MPGAVQLPQEQQQQSPGSSSKKKFGTVRGIGAAIKDSSGTLSNQISHSWIVGREALPLNRRSRDTPPRYSRRRKHRVQQSSATDVEFFETTAPGSHNADSFEPFIVVENMKRFDPSQPRYNRRPPVRMDNQDGPWSVSVAETPHDPQSYSLYVKTPTHNLTLTRTALEIIELHQKFRDSLPGMILPTLPLDPASLPTPPPKRKSNFLHTLSRFTSANAGKAQRSPSVRRTNHTSGPPSAHPSNFSSPVVSPTQEIGDPFDDENTHPINGALSSTTTTTTNNNNNATTTGLAAYLTTISNTADLRQARVWKRFVRVRTDDLESVRVERAIKRVRSDLAAHVLSRSDLNGDAILDEAEGETASLNGSAAELEAGFVREGARQASVETRPDEGPGTQEGVDGRSETSTVDGEAKPLREDDTTGDADAMVVDGHPHPHATPKLSDAAALAGARIHRSQSADPDKSSRLSRAYAESTTTAAADNSMSQAGGDQTGDESSTSTTGVRRMARKKRSQSIDPSKELAKKKAQRKVAIDDFEMMRVLGKGCAGKVLLVRHKSTSDLYALKAITKRHVLAHQELQHTLTEQAVLKRMAAEGGDPFVVKLWWSFHDKENLFLVMDFHPGGDLATQLARWGRLGRDRARFYAAEIVEGVEGLHAAGVIYRDLKPENILIGADGHIVLTDFGLSKEFPRRSAAITAPSTPSGTRDEFCSSSNSSPSDQVVVPSWMKAEKGQPDLAGVWPAQAPGHADSTSTFCGTAEYLAPEVIQGLNYSYEVDWWSFGTMLYEMLTGITPFWANNHSDMYVRVLQDELQFPDDRAIDQDTKSLIRGLLQRTPALRMCEPRIKRHPYFSMIDWSHVYYKRYIPPYIPPIDPSNAFDTQNFDDTFLDMEPVINDTAEDNEQTDTDQERGEQTDTDRTDGGGSNTTPSRSRSSSVHPRDEDVDVFDGYSFRGPQSVIIGEEEEDAEESGEDEEDEEEEEEEGEQPVGDGLAVEKEPEEPRQEESPFAVGAAAVEEEEEAVEPKTPEARPASLRDGSSEDGTAKAVCEGEELPPELPSKEVERIKDAEHTKDAKTKAPAPPSKTPPSRTIVTRYVRNRREKSGVPALDRYLSDTIDEDEEVTERDDEDDDWDIVEAGVGEDRNGAKGTSLFARGVVDKYRLAVFRKASSPSQGPASRSVSGVSQINGSNVDSPTPSDKRSRGRDRGLLRRNPRPFLQPKSSSSTHSGKSNKSGMATGPSATFSASVASTSGLVTPSDTMSPSLRSKESASSVGFLSDHSGNGDMDMFGPKETVRAPRVREKNGKHKSSKSRKLQKYKEGAEKMLSLFASPRQT